MAAVVRRVFPSQAASFPTIRDLVAGKRGFEIGGASPSFARGGIIPIYPLVESVDNCNFGQQTIWEGTITSGSTFHFDPGHAPGQQFISEATSLPMIPSGKYDFVLSCHSLEHTANPLRALREWMRILKDNGVLVLVLPHKEATFDHLRPTTPLKHLIEDFEANRDESDQTHVPEIAQFYDIGRDWGVNNIDELIQRAKSNLQIRAVHHHVFDVTAAAAMVDHAGMQIRSAEAMRPFHIIVCAQKIPAGTVPRNDAFLSPTAEWRRHSPFQVDRAASN
jgi:SAM-dependent methyltransferase